MKCSVRMFAMFLVLLFAVVVVHAQTNVAQPPNFHFVAGGSAIGFSGVGQGTQVGSVAYTGLQLTQSTAITYEHITVPSLNARYELGVASYTRPLNALLGQKLSSKFVFDTTNINVTFSGGAGKLLTPTANHIAETFGASVSYPIPGTSAAVQILGYQLVHSPSQFGLVTRNYQQQVQSGLIIYF